MTTVDETVDEVIKRESLRQEIIERLDNPEDYLGVGAYLLTLDEQLRKRLLAHPNSGPRINRMLEDLAYGNYTGKNGNGKI